ncbi:hypothetical protein GALL_504720 [mine drainage metagenome]|uniref:DprA winged helix domain-containing protein n=1 Tax=mine drainage metagenome TaxID=410659 RepID=A0A1J5PRN4_9ZZZZ
MEHKAELVTELDDVLLHIGPLLIENTETITTVSARDGLAPDEKSLLELFPARTSLSIETLAHLSDLAPNRILGLLGLLATAGFVEHEGAGWILTKKGKAA